MAWPKMSKGHCMIQQMHSTSASHFDSHFTLCLQFVCHWSTSYCNVSDRTDNLLYSSRCFTLISSIALVANTVAAIDSRKLKKMKAASRTKAIMLLSVTKKVSWAKTCAKGLPQCTRSKSKGMHFKAFWAHMDNHTIYSWASWHVQQAEELPILHSCVYWL